MIINYFRNLITGKPVFNWQTCLVILLTSLGFNSLKAQVSEYNFSQSTGTFSSISGGTVLGVATGNTAATNLNSNVYPVTIPFAFNFNGQNYTSLNVSTNGYITFGTTAPSTTLSAPISGTTAYDGAVSAFGHSISSFYDIAGKTGDISWQTVGAAPNREVVIQWTNFRPTSSTSTTSVYAFSFQIRLQETTNTISVVYSAGSYLVGSTGYSSAVNQVGLRGATNADFNNRFNATTTPYVNSVSGTTNGDDQAFSTVNATPGMPSEGLVYTWTPPTCLRPTNPVISNVTTSSATLSWTPSISNPANGYDVYYSTASTAPTASTTPTLTGIMGTSTPIAGLTPSTTYFVWIRSACSSTDKSNWLADAVMLYTACQPPAITGTSVTPTPVCVGGTATLSATADAGATIKWYDAPTGGNLLASGASYTSPVLTATTDYYVSASTSGTSNVGKVTLESNASTGGGLTSYLVFTALSDFTLNTVDLFPYSATAGTPGTVTIELRSSTGTSIMSTTVNVTGQNSVASSVPQTVPVNFPITGGQSYRLGVAAWTGITNMYRDATNLAFPYSAPGVVDITGGSLSTPYYYFFYNWNITSVCESARTMVTAAYDSTCALGTSEASVGNEITIYPNPFTDMLNISEVKNVQTATITDLSGRTLKTISEPTSQIYLGDLKTGMYLITLQYKDGRVNTLKAIKK